LTINYGQMQDGGLLPNFQRLSRNKKKAADCMEIDHVEVNTPERSKSKAKITA